ncbi:MAG: hypothetical protein M1820_007150 [Bogoriella megaspora]|nr:MAG: hypothetical protein M1820_007150 [Bogoriella megaspora]
MEVGPGRGTLMDDALRTIRKFPPLAAAIESIYLVEASPALRHAQKQLLCGDAPMKETDVGFESTSKHSSELKVTWSEDIRFIPKDASKTPFIIAHEFFDALPIHIFQSVPPAASDSTITTSAATAPSLSPPTRRKQEPQWRELMVSPTPAPNRFLATEKELESAKDQPDFQLALAKASTPHSLYLPELSQRYKALKSIPDSIIEISPESQSYAADFATRIGGGNSKPPASPAGSYQEPSQPHSTRTVASPNTQSTLHKPQPSGAALILDYGPTSTIPTNSLRGIRAHKLCSPFSEPGKTDISADVDFVALAEAAINASPGVEVHGPVEQGVWLHAMGGLERVGQLVKAAMGKASGRERDEVAGEDGDEGAGAGGDDSKGRKMKDGLREEVERIEAGWRRLVDRGPQGMGRIYKVMAMVPYVEVKEGEVRRRPVGFGGDVKV